MSDHPIRKYVAKRQVTVKVQYGKELRKAKCFANSMSTYVEVSIGKETRKTSTQKKAGRNPKWYDEFIFNYDNEPHIEIKCWCENGCCGEKLVGEGHLELPPPARINDHNIPLSFEGKKGAKFGLVNILVTFSDQGIEHLERDAAKDALATALSGAASGAAPAAAAPQPITINVVQNNGGGGGSNGGAGSGYWQWDYNGTWKNINGAVAETIEQSYQAFKNGGSANTVVNMGGAQYSIHFGKMTQMNLTTKKIRSIRRS